MALRIPKAELPHELAESMIAQLGAVPENVEVLWHSPRVAQDNLDFGGRVGAWGAADAGLKSFAHMAVAAQVGCSWCLDVGYFQAANQDLDLVKAGAVTRWRESDVFSGLEREVLEYAEAMTTTPPTVTDTSFCRQEGRRQAETLYPDRTPNDAVGVPRTPDDRRFPAEIRFYEQCMTRLGYVRASATPVATVAATSSMVLRTSA